MTRPFGSFTPFLPFSPVKTSEKLFLGFVVVFHGNLVLGVNESGFYGYIVAEKGFFNLRSKKIATTPTSKIVYTRI